MEGLCKKLVRTLVSMVTMLLLCKLENVAMAKIMGPGCWNLICEHMSVISIYLLKMSEIYLTVLELGPDNLSGNWASKYSPVEWRLSSLQRADVAFRAHFWLLNASWTTCFNGNLQHNTFQGSWAKTQKIEPIIVNNHMLFRTVIARVLICSVHLIGILQPSGNTIFHFECIKYWCSYFESYNIDD